MYKSTPQLGKNVKLAKSAIILGNVKIGDNCSVWHNAVVRCEETSIYIGDNTNIQDNCVLHVDPYNEISIGSFVTIGHGAIVHGCTIGNNVLIGMGAIVMNGAIIHDNCIIGAGALVTEGKEIEEGSIIVGNPGKFARKVSARDIEHIRMNAEHYVEISREYL